MASPYYALLIYNEKREVLLHQRDDNPGIRYPGQLGALGGHIRERQTPEQALLSKMPGEFIGSTLKDFKYLGALAHEDFLVYVYTKYMPHKKAESYKVTEGQGCIFISEGTMNDFKLAGNTKMLLEAFFSSGQGTSR